MDHDTAQKGKGLDMSFYVQTDRMSVGYQKKAILNDITLELSKGEVLTLIGPNGAGKSTVLKSIARQLELVGGSVFLDGKNMTEISDGALSQKMAVVFTEKIKSEYMTCEDVVATGRYPYTGYFGILSEKDKEVVRDAMEAVHLMEIRDQDFSKISDGQRQRVMLARAICQQPEIIILDEPTSFLDVRYKLEFLSILQELRTKRGLTVIMSLHELELAERISDRIMCIDGARVDRIGTPEEVFRKGYIRKLFSIETGSYDEENGSMELQAVRQEADVFVLGGGGSARACYRRLQREGKVFITGILYDNDLDFPVAQALSKEVLFTKAFEPVDEALIVQAKQKIDEVSTVICCRDHFGSLDTANRELYEYAKQQKKLEAG